MTDKTVERQAERVAVLERAIERSRMSTRQYARTVLMRDPRTVYRWLKLERPVPAVVAERLLELEREE